MIEAFKQTGLSPKDYGHSLVQWDSNMKVLEGKYIEKHAEYQYKQLATKQASDLSLKAGTNIMDNPDMDKSIILKDTINAKLEELSELGMPEDTQAGIILAGLKGFLAKNADTITGAEFKAAVSDLEINGQNTYCGQVRVHGILARNELFAVKINVRAGCVCGIENLFCHVFGLYTADFRPKSANYACVSGNKYGFSDVLPHNLQNCVIKAIARLGNALSAGNGKNAEVVFPAADEALGIFGNDVVDATTLPVTEINLAKLLAVVDLQTAQIGVRRGGVVRAKQIARVDRVDPLTSQKLGRRSRLLVASRRKVEVLVTQRQIIFIAKALAMAH